MEGSNSWFHHFGIKTFLDIEVISKGDLIVISAQAKATMLVIQGLILIAGNVSNSILIKLLS